jgi:hypothetical protein
MVLTPLAFCNRARESGKQKEREREREKLRGRKVFDIFGLHAFFDFPYPEYNLNSMLPARNKVMQT